MFAFHLNESPFFMPWFCRLLNLVNPSSFVVKLEDRLGSGIVYAKLSCSILDEEIMLGDQGEKLMPQRRVYLLVLLPLAPVFYGLT